MPLGRQQKKYLYLYNNNTQVYKTYFKFVKVHHAGKEIWYKSTYGPIGK